MTDGEITIISVTECEKGVRKIPKNNRSVTGRAETRQGTVPYESTLERDFAHLVEFDGAVERIISQPLRIHYRVGDGPERRYTADFLLRFRSLDGARKKRPGLYEIKYRDELRDRWEELEPGFRAARKLCRSRGWSFQVITERRIRGQYLDNVAFLRDYRGYSDNGGIGIKLLETLKGLDTSTPAILLAAAFMDRENRALAVGVMWRLIADGYIGTNLTRKFSMNMEIWYEDLLQE